MTTVNSGPIPRRRAPTQATTPVLVLGAERDRIFVPAMVHNMTLEAGWQQVADRVHHGIHQLQRPVTAAHAEGHR